MKTTLYWTMQHCRHAVREFRFRATCWWLSQHVEFLAWRLRLEALMPSVQSVQSDPAPTSDRQGSPYAVHTM